MIEITFNLQKHIDYGQAVFVSGNLTNIGLWAPEKSFRLNWSQGHKWSGTLRIQKNDFLNKRILEYKYFIGKWQSPIPNQIQWQKGQINRQIELNMLLNHQKIGKLKKIIQDDEWNTRKIKIHLVTKKCITPNQSTQYRYSIIGNCPQLGNWKVRKVLKIQQNIDCKTIRKLSEKINKKDLISFLKNQLIFQVHATTLHLPLEQEKFSYYFIRENEKLQIQRHPGRCFILLNPQNYPHRYSVIYSSENIGIYDEQNFDRPTFSKITPEIYLGSYLKNQNDLKHLKNLGIQAIYSIQTEEDHQDHGISTFYLELLCRQYGILFKTIQIQDKNSRDFVNKSTKAVVQIDELIKNGNTTYVYCSAGKYRSPQMVALYLTLKNGINVTDAVKFIKEKHPVARPNQRIIKNAVYHINKFKVNFSDSQASVESITN